LPSLKSASLLLLAALLCTARDVTIVRDDWGIAHVYGKTDADAVYGMIYAQAEDDFNRVETNYLNALGRLAEAEGESKVYQDLRMKLFIDPEALKQEYKQSPLWLQSLMNAFADGLNDYLSHHPEVKPRVITHFEPWMALSFTEGSIGGDIERIDLQQLEAFYGHRPMPSAANLNLPPAEPSGSNGIAIAPKNTASHHALLLINPHTSFFFRSELQMVSDEGLDAYGAVTWGQFFVYQGFNPHVGWMHTSSGVDAVDEYLETVSSKNNRFVYRYGAGERPVSETKIVVPFKTTDGAMAQRTFTVYRTHHGPVIRGTGGHWVSIRLMQEHIKALEQSYLRTKAVDYKSYRQTMELKANSSNNTVFADADGDIAYFHGNFIPRRDTRFDFTKPVDGSDPATDWKGLLSIEETPHLLNPASGWLYNSNNWPWSAAGASSPKREDYPAYVETGTESARGLHAIRVLQGKNGFTLDSLIAAAYDSYLPWFDKPIPALLRAWNGSPETPLKQGVAAQIRSLREWDHRWAVGSVPTSLAVFWGEELRRRFGDTAKKQRAALEDFVSASVPGEQLLESLNAASGKLNADFGTWQTPWGEINRFQRINGAIVQPFSDAKPSIPVGFTSSFWGSLASFGARAYPGTKKWYGTSGNSFVAVVEFGDKVRAKAVTAGGESGHPNSPHFDDEAQRYSTGNLRDVYFYRSDLQGHIQRTYRPGE
jgi:acyl-homoserine-lactone acylase